MRIAGSSFWEMYMIGWSGMLRRGLEAGRGGRPGSGIGGGGRRQCGKRFW